VFLILQVIIIAAVLIWRSFAPTTGTIFQESTFDSSAGSFRRFFSSVSASPKEPHLSTSEYDKQESRDRLQPGREVA
jgi:hypothetical protein